MKKFGMNNMAGTFVLMVVALQTARAAVIPQIDQTSPHNLTSILSRELAKNYGGARIDLLPPFQWIKGNPQEEIQSLTLLNDDGRGNIHFSIINREGYVAEGVIGFRAWVSAKIAIRRMRSGETLTPDNFITQELNIANGVAHEYRGVIFPAQNPIVGLETIQTVLEGQFLTSAAVRKIPDVRRGDTLRVRLISGDLTLTTAGISEESGYLNQLIKVRTSKTKKELTGFLRSGNEIEVQL